MCVIRTSSSLFKSEDTVAGCVAFFLGLRNKKGTEADTRWCARMVKVWSVAACEDTVISVEYRIGCRTFAKAVRVRVVVDNKRERCAAVTAVGDELSAEVNC